LLRVVIEFVPIFHLFRFRWNSAQRYAGNAREHLQVACKLAPDGRTFLMEFHLLVHHEIVWRFKRKGHLRKVRVLGHRVQHLQSCLIRGHTSSSSSFSSSSSSSGITGPWWALTCSKIALRCSGSCDWPLFLYAHIL
jgi:hypothetical protein